MEKIVVIVAGGTGKRMESKVPKQFLLLNGHPVLMHSIQVFRKYDASVRIILVLPEVYIETWERLCKKYNFDVIHEKRSGGKNRFESVKSGIEGIPDDCLVAIHDGIRPLVSLQTISRCFAAAMEFGNAIPCTEISETIRRIEAHGNFQADRGKHRLIQTPQVFKGSILKQAYKQEYNEHFTDDAIVVENKGHKIHLVEGNADNIKVTYKHDLIIAEALMKHNRLL